MKKNLRLATMLIGFCVFAGNAAVCFGQPGRMAGGYNAVDKTDQTDAAVAANFAVQTQSKKGAPLKLVSIERAERQVVAGSNYRLCLTVESKNKAQEATAIVYQNLQDEFSLTSWTNGKCAGASADETPAADETSAAADEPVSYKGALEVGKTASTILYVGAETGDYAAFCFDNNLAVGRAILAACKTGEQCEFIGQVDFESPCKVKGLEADLSASGRITKIESVKSFARKGAAATKTAVVPASAALAPDIIVKNLYAAQKADRGPFFQNENRAVVDQYFSKDFADLIWKDASGADGVGVLNFDPLYNAQDSEITAFAVGKPQFDTKSGIATVTVSFKNFGKADTVKYLFAQDKAKNWKITDVRYKNGDMLKGMLADAMKAN